MEPSHCGIRIAGWGLFVFTLGILGNLEHFRHLSFVHLNPRILDPSHERVKYRRVPPLLDT